MWLEKIFRGLPSTSTVTSLTPMASSSRASARVRTWPSSKRISPVAGWATGARRAWSAARTHRASFLLNLYRPTMLRS